MDLPTFRGSLSAPEPPDGATQALRALWWDAKGDWDRAHDAAQAECGVLGSLVHGYLHRKEGDLGNAGYWYRRAGRPMPGGTLDAEWQELAMELLGSA